MHMRLDHDVPAPGQLPLTDVSTVVVDDLTALSHASNRPTRRGATRERRLVSMDDRMNFITNLFRSRHHRMALFEPPSRLRCWPTSKLTPCRASQRRRLDEVARGSGAPDGSGLG